MFLVELPVGSTFDPSPPLLVVQIPVDGLGETLGERNRRRPAQLIFQFEEVNPVPPVMPRTVGYKTDQCFGFSQGSEDVLDDLQIGSLPLSSDVIDLPFPPLFQDEPNGPAAI